MLKNCKQRGRLSHLLVHRWIKSKDDLKETGATTHTPVIVKEAGSWLQLLRGKFFFFLLVYYVDSPYCAGTASEEAVPLNPYNGVWAAALPPCR